jgi:clan AA aspartic protease
VIAERRWHVGVATLGKVLVTARIENLEDLYAAERGSLPRDQVRSVEVADALVDTGATTFSMPRRLIQQLGLRPFTTRRIRTSAGPVEVPVYEAVRVSIQDRNCTCDVVALPDDCPALIGQVPLEVLDFVVDPVGQRLVGNPEHNGEWMADQF